MACIIQKNFWSPAFCAAALCFFSAVGHAAQSVDVASEIQDLRDANRALREQLSEQRGLIETLTHQMADVQRDRTQQNQMLQDLKLGNNAPAPARGFNVGNIHFSGEAGLGFFKSSDKGPWPNSEFRVDEAKLFIESPVWGDVYVFGELNLITREAYGVNLNVGEFYLDWTDLLQLWGRDRMLNVRLGRMDIPFGEEYLTRDAIDNPLISHSVADFWGVDEGLELYGSAGKFSYCLAVQNGGIPDNRDFNGDKSVAARLSFDPASWLHMSVSAMRTGNLDVQGDGVSAMWFGNGFFRSLGSSSATVFHADMIEGDAKFSWKSGYLSASGGAICYGDDDSTGSNRREVYYYSAEAHQQLARHLYAAGRFSGVTANQGFPLVGNGSFGDYFYGDLTRDLWRLSLGLGWQWSENFVTKVEYTMERGRTVTDMRRRDDMVAVEAAVKF